MTTVFLFKCVEVHISSLGTRLCFVTLFCHSPEVIILRGLNGT